MKWNYHRIVIMKSFINNKIIHTAVILFALSCCYPLFAQGGPGRYPLKTLITRSLEKHAGIASQSSRIQEYRELEKHVQRWENPSLGLELGKKTAEGESGTVYGLSLSQIISLPGKKEIMSGIARLEANKAALGLDELKLFIRYEVVRLSYEYMIIYERTRHMRERLGRLRLVNSYMQGRLLVSPQKIVEKSIIQSRIAILEKELAGVKTSLKTAFSKLNIYASLKDVQPPEIELSWFRKSPPVSRDDFMEGAMKNSFLLRVQQTELAAAEKNAALAGAQVYPDIGISVFYQKDTTDAGERTIGGGVSFPVPLLSQNRHAVRQHEARFKSEELMLRHLRNTVKEQMKGLFARYEYAASMLEKFPLAMMNTLEQSMRYADREFRRGRVQMVTYLEMDTQTHEMVESIYESQMELVRVYTALLFSAAMDREVNGN